MIWVVNQAIKLISASSIFNSFVQQLIYSFSRTLIKIAAYVTKILLPKVVAICWWNPWVVAGIVVGAVALIVTTIVILYNSYVSKIRNKISNKIKTKDGRIDIGKFRKKPGSGPHRWIGPLGYELIKDMSEHKGPAYKLFQYGKRIATVGLDGLILGK